MPDDTHARMRVECTECQFARVIEPADEELPGEIIQRHGDETDHTLNVTELDDE